MRLRSSLAAFLLVLGLAAPAAAACTTTVNLGLCKGARGDLDWDSFMNNNMDLLDASVLSTGSGAQSKSGTLTLSNATPLKLSLFTTGSVPFIGAAGAITQNNAKFFWDATNFRLGIGTGTPATALDVVGTASLTGFKMPTGASAGFVMTADGSGNGTWQAAGASATGWADNGTVVSLTTLSDKVSLTATTATEKLEVGGAIKVGTDAGAPTAGVIRWNGTHFQGYNGSAFVDLDFTSASAGGWTDNGATLTLTTATDTIGIGAAADADAHVAITPTANLSGLRIGGYSLTGADASAALIVRGTWNTTGAPSLIDADVTNTASDAASLLAKLSVGGSSKFSVDKTGAVTAVGNVTAPSIKLTTGATNGFILTSDASGNGTWQVSAAGSGVPSGMIALFDAACPAGWTRYATLDAKFPRGAAAWGAGAGSDTHTHAVDVPATTTTADGAHNHTINPPATATDSQGNHSHGTFNTGAGGSSGGQDTTFVDLAHTHTYSGTTSTGNSLNNAASGLAFSAETDTHTHTFSGTTSGASVSMNHRHTVPTSTTTTAGAHTHTVDIGAFLSSTDGSHTHTVDPASFTSGSASNVPAYVDMVYCKKN